MSKTPEAALVAAQAYLYTTQPNPGDPREHIHRAVLHGLRLVGNKLTAKEEKTRRNEVHTNPDHHAVTIVLGVGAEVDDPGHHHKSTTIAQGTKEPKDPSLPIRRMTTKTTKRRCYLWKKSRGESRKLVHWVHLIVMVSSSKYEHQ
jgi:hypothetical protein